MTWIHREPLNRWQRVSYGLLVFAAALAGLTGWRAWTLEPLPAELADVSELSAPELGTRARYSVEDAIRSVRRDPFHPDRRAPAARYLLPEPESVAAELNVGRPLTGSIRLLGTVVNASSGGFVMAQWGGDAARMVHVGDTLGAWTLRAVARASADFVDALGDTLTVRLPSASGGTGGG
jgi:hypothetical protein